MFGLNDSTFLQYVQLRSIWKHFTSKGIILGLKSVLDGKLRDAVTGWETVSDKLLKLSLTVLSPWNYNLDEIWDQPSLWIGGTSTMSTFGRYIIHTNKVIHWVYITQHTKKNCNKYKNGPNASELCWHNWSRTGKIIHLMRPRPIAEEF